MGFSLTPGAIEQGYRLTALESVGSTNEAALDSAFAGGAGRTWFVTDNQTAGRGRRGRPWQDGKGNLAASLLLLEALEPARMATLGFVAGVALAEALEAVVPAARVAVGIDSGDVIGGGRFALKWPNDVLVEGAKLSGILLETRGLAGGRYALAVGIGVNVVNHPQGLDYPATSLRALGAGCKAPDMFLALSDAWAEAYGVWHGPGGVDAIRRRWLSRAAGLGAPVAVSLGEGVLRGVFETIDEECRFVILTEDGGRRAIAAGDVHFGAVVSA